MAHDVMHLLLLERVQAHPDLHPEVAHLLASRARYAQAGALLVDMPYFESFASKVVSHLRHRVEPPSPWGDRFHQRVALGLVRALLDIARDQPDPGALQAVALGHLTHAVLDLETHPDVNRYVEQSLRWEADRAGLHRQVENVQVELWHRELTGQRLFGTRRMGALGSSSAPWLWDATLLEGVAAATRMASGESPSRGDWRRWSLGLWEYGALVGSSLGLRYFDERDLHRLRPWFDGPEVHFRDTWDRALQRSVADLTSAWDLAQSSGGLDRAVFAQRFPELNLDDPLRPPLRD